MSRRPRRQAKPALAPRGLRPKLTADQVRDLGIVHITNLDLIAKGEATAEVLLQVMGGVLTWHRVAQIIGRGEAEMVEQLALFASVFDRFQQHGRVGFTGPEYQLAERGVETQDALAELVDQHTAVAAAAWSEAQVTALNTSRRTA